VDLTNLTPGTVDNMPDSFIPVTLLGAAALAMKNLNN
jgi:hypothetical protein